MSGKYVGARLPRVDDARLVTGHGRFMDDLRLPQMVCAHFLRSPHPHARILRIDSRQALQVSGVVGVWTAQDIASQVKPIRATLDSPQYQPSDWPALAAGKVRFVGEPVAVVVAPNRYLAEDAAQWIEVEYEPLPPLPNAEASLSNPRNRVHDSMTSNIFFECETTGGDVEKAFQEADVRIARTFRHPRCASLPIENRGVLAQYAVSAESPDAPDSDDAQGILTVWSSTQIPDVLRKALAESLQHPQDRLRVIAPDVGGAFGVKMHVFPEELVVAHLARALRRPVKWMEDRLENLMASLHARDHVLQTEVAASKDGTILALKVRDLCDAGAYSAFPITAALEPLSCSSALPGPYKIENYHFQSKAVATNKCPVGANRGVGFALGPFVTERLMDLVAQELRLDPAEVRKMNFIPPSEFPYTGASGTLYDSGQYRAALERALERVGYEGIRRRQQQLWAEGRYIGVGLSCFIEPTGMGRRVYRQRGMADVPAFDAATIELDPSGTVRAYLSTPSQGQGQQTTFAQLLADELGAPLGDIAIFMGDTATCPPGNGTFASRSIVSAGSALVCAAREVRQRLLVAAAHLVQTPPQDLRIRNGEIFATNGNSPLLSLRELVQALHSPESLIPKELRSALRVTHQYSLAGAAISYGTHVAVVEVDIETGTVRLERYVAVDDCGTIINPTIVEGQVRGGVAQGIGTALYENVVYDEQGQLLTASLMDYLAPGATEVPCIEIEHLQTPSPFTENGSKGVGESGIIAAPAAICNAVSDALRPFGACFTKMPIRPQDILAAVSSEPRLP